MNNWYIIMMIASSFEAKKQQMIIYSFGVLEESRKSRVYKHQNFIELLWSKNVRLTNYIYMYATQNLWHRLWIV